MILLSIPGMLESKEFKYNQTKLAKLLNLNRGTLRKYMNDVNNLDHVVLRNGSNLTFMCITHGASHHQ